MTAPERARSGEQPPGADRRPTVPPTRARPGAGDAAEVGRHVVELGRVVGTRALDHIPSQNARMNLPGAGEVGRRSVAAAAGALGAVLLLVWAIRRSRA